MGSVGSDGRVRRSAPEQTIAGGRGTRRLSSMLRLQRSIGNRAVGELLNGAAPGRMLARDHQQAPSPTAQGAGQTAAPPASSGLQVHPNSKLSAGAFVAKLKANHQVPDWLKHALLVSGGRIQLSGPLNPSAGRIWMFVDDFQAAFAAGDWIMTTGRGTVTVTEDGDGNETWTQRVDPDLGKDERVGDWVRMGPGDPTFSPTPIFLTGKGLQTGQTIQTPTSASRSSENLIIVVNRFDVTNAKGKTRRFNASDDLVAESVLHEISAHAGEIARGKPGNHGTETHRTPSDRTADEIGGLFRDSNPDGTLKLSSTAEQVLAFIKQGRSKPAAAKHP